MQALASIIDELDMMIFYEHYFYLTRDTQECQDFLISYQQSCMVRDLAKTFIIKPDDNLDNPGNFRVFIDRIKSITFPTSNTNRFESQAWEDFISNTGIKSIKKAKNMSDVALSLEKVLQEYFRNLSTLKTFSSKFKYLNNADPKALSVNDMRCKAFLIRATRILNRNEKGYTFMDAYYANKKIIRLYDKHPEIKKLEIAYTSKTSGAAAGSVGLFSPLSESSKPIIPPAGGNVQQTQIP